MQHTDSPAVTVVIAAYNEEKTITACLHSVVRQEYPAKMLEILVIDDGSTDNTAKLARQLPGVTYLHQRQQGPAAARNLGARHARGELIAFLDADCEAPPGWLSTLVRTFIRLQNSSPIAGLGGAQYGHPDDPPYARQVDTFLRAVGFIGDYVKPFQQERRVSHNASCNVLYAKQSFLQAGGFREGLFPAEDVDLDRRLHKQKLAIWFTPKAMVNHHRANTPEKFRKMIASYARSQADVVFLHGLFRKIHAMPFLSAVLSLLLIVLGCLHPLVFAVLAAAGLAITTIFSRKTGLSLKTSFLFIAYTYVLYTYVFIARLIQNTFSPPGFLMQKLRPLA